MKDPCNKELDWTLSDFISARFGITNFEIRNQNPNKLLFEFIAEFIKKDWMVTATEHYFVNGETKASRRSTYVERYEGSWGR